MAGSLFIAGDWGSSHLRLYLCQYHEAKPLVAIASCTGRGVSQIDGDFEQVFFDLAADWIKAHGPLEVILSGAVGSTLGWKNTRPKKNGLAVTSTTETPSAPTIPSLLCSMSGLNSSTLAISRS